MQVTGLKPRLYQEVIAAKATQKHTLVVLPTGLGKTIVSLMVAIHQLKKFPDKKILLLAPTRPLVNQHLDSFKQFLDGIEYAVFTGSVKPEKRKEQFEQAQVIMSTPQCVTGDSIIYTEDGVQTIKEFVETHDLISQEFDKGKGYMSSSNKSIVALKEFCFKNVPVSKVWKLPSRETIELDLELSKKIQCTPEHPLYTVDENANPCWKKSSELIEGDFVGIPNKIHFPEKKYDLLDFLDRNDFRVLDGNIKKLFAELSNNDSLRLSKSFNKYGHSCSLSDYHIIHNLIGKKVPSTLLLTNKTGRSKPVRFSSVNLQSLSYILGAMVGDGHIGNRSSKHGSEVVLSELMYEDISNKFTDLVESVFGIRPSSYQKKGIVYYNTCFANVLANLGIKKGCKTYTTSVPKIVLNGSQKSICAFLSGYFNADGDATKHMVRFATVSKKLANELEFLLLRLGIVSGIEIRKGHSQKIAGHNAKSQKCYVIYVTGRDNLTKLLQKCDFSENKIHNLRVSLEKTKNPQTRSKDILPVSHLLTKYYQDSIKKNLKLDKEVLFTCKNGYYSKSHLKKILAKLPSYIQERIEKLLQLPLRWVKVKKKKVITKKSWVYDVTVDKHHNFVANGILNHNTVENDILASRIKLDKVSLVIFDEAHRATGEYSYVWVAKQFEVQSPNGRILGLTASPGADKETIQEVLDNLRIEQIEFREHTDPDVKPYVKDIVLTYDEVDLPESIMSVHSLLSKCYANKINQIKQNGMLSGKNAQNLQKKELLMFTASLQREIAQQRFEPEILSSLSLSAQALKISHAIELCETQGIPALYSYMQSLLADAKARKSKAVQAIAQDGEFRTAFVKTRDLVVKQVTHPKVTRLCDLVSDEIKKKKDVKILIFSQFRDTLSMLEKELSHISGVKACQFLGQAKKKGVGMSQKEQLKTIQDFKDNIYNVLCMSSVGEEGLDIPSVDLVIFYEPIASTIRTIQRRGRTGRQDVGRVNILCARNTRDMAIRWIAKRKEAKMYSVLADMKIEKALTPQPTLESFEVPKVEEEFKMYADSREKKSGILRQLHESGIKILMDKLDIGDFILSKDVVIEYKRVGDFVDSILDGRLFTQLKKLKETVKKPVLVIEGEESIFGVRNVHPNAILGMLSTIAVSYQIPLVFTRTESETANLFQTIIKREQSENKKEFSPHTAQKKDVGDELLYVVSSLPSVGPLLAKRLLSRFGTLHAIVTASVDDIASVEGFGKQRAQNLLSFFHKKQ